MSHFSIGYQPEEENGNIVTIVFGQQAAHHQMTLSDGKASVFRDLIKTYLKLVSRVASVPVSGLVK